MLKIAVVDDEIVFVESLINKITAVCEKLNLEFKIDKYSNGFDILENYSKYHLIFLDIEMPSIDGIATAKRINELKGSAEIPFIVYVTSHDELVFDALKSFPYSFIRKSKIESDLYECINRINNSFEELHKTIVLHTERKDIPIVIGDIIYLEKIKNYVEKIKYELMGGTEAIHNSEIWKVLSYAQRERFEEKEENPSKSKSLIYAKAKNNSVVNAKNRSIFSIFRKEPQIPLTERDLAKISIDWLAKYIPKDMLQELEADRNKEENNIRDKEYLPDPKAPIYEMIKSVTRFGIPNRKDYVLQDENGSKIYIFIEDQLSSNLYWTSIVMEAGSIKVVKNYSTQLEFKERGVPRHLNAILNLAQIIDRCFNTDFQQQLLREVKECWIERTKKQKLFKKLEKSLYKMRNEYGRTKLDFFASEERKREKFYSQYRLQERIKVNPEDLTNDNEKNNMSNEVIQEKEQGGENAKE